VVLFDCRQAELTDKTGLDSDDTRKEPELDLSTGFPCRGFLMSRLPGLSSRLVLYDDGGVAAKQVERPVPCRNVAINQVPSTYLTPESAERMGIR
jgi:hypothetical protein